MKLWAPLAKTETLDDGTFCIRGVASAETVDSAGEVIKADAMKAALPDFFKFGTGALREMHQLSAAGTVDEAEVEGDKTFITATVVDKAAIEKVKRGVYKGFSIGGRVMKRDAKDKNIITALKLTEISLVDRPCNSSATFTLWKADTLAPSVVSETIRREVAVAMDEMTGPERALILTKAIHRLGVGRTL